MGNPAETTRSGFVLVPHSVPVIAASVTFAGAAAAVAWLLAANIVGVLLTCLLAFIVIAGWLARHTARHSFAQRQASYFQVQEELEERRRASQQAQCAITIGRLAGGAALTDQWLARDRPAPARPGPVDVAALIEAMRELLHAAVGGNVEVETRLVHGVGLTPADPAVLAVLLLELVLNARDAMPQGGRLTIETSGVEPSSPPGPGRIMLRITDTGPGPPADLAGVRSLVRQAGGDVQVDSHIGTGTLVVIDLPTVPASASDQLPALSEPADPPSGATVLLVDDDEAVRTTTGLILESMGYTVLAAAAGQEAIDCLRADQSVDILLTDVAMPIMNGPELARAVRMIRPFLPVVFVSGYADPDAVAGNPIHQRIVRKPFRAAELAAQIEAALAEARTAA